MSLLDQAKADYKSILDDKSQFSIDLTFINLNASETVTVAGHGMTHHLKIDMTTGQAVNGRQSHITVSEQTLVDAGYTVRDAKNKVSLKNHKVSFSGDNYRIIEYFPDNTLGIITCILQLDLTI